MCNKRLLTYSNIHTSLSYVVIIIIIIANGVICVNYVIICDMS